MNLLKQQHQLGWRKKKTCGKTAIPWKVRLSKIMYALEKARSRTKDKEKVERKVGVVDQTWGRKEERKIENQTETKSCTYWCEYGILPPDHLSWHCCYLGRMMICYYCCCYTSYCYCSNYSSSSDPSCCCYLCSQCYTFLPHCCYLLLIRCQLLRGVEESPKLKDGVIGGEDDDEEGEVSEPVELETCWVGEDKKKENGWLLQQQDGESQNTFIWTGWMTGWMDGWKKLHNHDIHGKSFTYNNSSYVQSLIETFVWKEKV